LSGRRPWLQRKRAPSPEKGEIHYFGLSGLGRFLWGADPGATCSAALRTCPWLLYFAPLALWSKLIFRAFGAVIHMTTIKVAAVKPTITKDLLDRVDIRAGTIKRVEDVKGSDKLVKLTVDFGDHTRTILVGMKQEREDPEQIEGMQTLFVINLEPRKIMGEVSEGMLLDIGYADGIKPVLALPEQEVPNGARAG
jgi:methionine--tRNA ligase beta chain